MTFFSFEMAVMADQHDAVAGGNAQHGDDAVIPVEHNQVMIPDFTLRDRSGREVYLEIVGFWTPEYLSRKIAKVTAARLDNLILAVSKRLALSEAAAKELDVLWFAGKLSASAVIERANSLVKDD